MSRRLFFGILIIIGCSVTAYAGGADTAALPSLDLISPGWQTTIFNTSLLRGKVLFINFWGISCVPCLEEMGGINELYDHFGDSADVMILPVELYDDVAADVKKATSFMAQHNYRLHIYSIAGAIPGAWFHGVLPTTVVIDRNGNMAYYHEGKDDYESTDFIAFIDKLLKK